MSNDIITTLHPDNDQDTNLYPNIKKENIPNGVISRNNLDNDLNNLLKNIGQLSPSGVDTSTNILAFTEDKGIYVSSDTGHWFYWDGTQYVDGGVYQTAVNYDTLEDLIETTTDNVIYNFVMNQRIPYNNLGVDISPVSDECSIRVNCDEGDEFYVKGYGGVNGRLWAWADESYNNLGDSGELVNTNGQYIKIVAPQNAKYLICNSYTIDDNIPIEYGLIKNELLIDKINNLRNDYEKSVNELTGSRQFIQFIKSNTKQDNYLYYTIDIDGNVTKVANSSCALFTPIHLEAGTYTVSHINFNYSFIWFDDNTGGNFRTMYPEESGTNVSFTFTLTQGATIYPTITTSDGYTNLMLVNKNELPNTYVDYGRYITGLNGSLSIGDYTIDDVNNFMNTYNGNIDTPFMYIKNGKVTSNGQLAQYAQVDMKSKITKIMSRVVFERNTTSVVTLIAMKNNNENINGPVANIGQGSIHINWGQNEVAVQYFSPDGVNHNLVGYSYESCVADGETEYQFGYEFLGDNTIRFYLPDGTTRDYTNENFDVNNGNYFVFETSGTIGSTADISFTGIYCSCETGTYLRDNFKRSNGPLGVANTGHTYRVFKSLRNTIYDF